MATTNENLIPIPGRLHSVAIEGHIAGADEIYDDLKGKTQDVINDEVETAIGSNSDPSSIKGRIKILEVAIGEGGSVPAMMDQKIGALDADVSQQAGIDGLSLSLQQVDGKVTNISGSIAANTYDDYGSAATVKEQLLGDAGLEYNTLGKLEDKIQEEVSTRTQTDEGLDSRLTTVESKIPSAASSDNKLADKEFVNSSISTATATFRGTSNTGLSEQEFLQWADSIAVKDNNDYIFWNTVDSVGNVQFKKYKYDGTQWEYEYTLNNSSFTADQWAAINSQLTSADRTKIDGIEEGAQVNIIETISVNSTPLPPANKAVNISVPTQLQELAEDSAHRIVTDAEKATWNAKQDAISDLEDIRSGAALGSTAYQKPDEGIPSTDMTAEVQASLGKADTAYQKPQTGIPESDLDTSTQTKINAGNTAYQLPDGGIPKTDLDTNVQGSLDKADSALQPAALDDYYDKTQTDNLLSQKQDNLTIDSTPVEDSGNPIASGYIHTLESNTNTTLDTKANKSELQITQGVDADKATIQLKEGVSTQVITEHQDISGKADISTTYTKTEVDDIISQVEAGQGSSLANYYTRTQIDSQQQIQDEAIALKANASDVNNKVDRLINGTNGRALIFNETDGGGAKFEHNDGTESYVGVNDGGESGIAAQIYADKLIDGKWQGAKLDIKNTGIYYTVGDKSAAERDVADNELATKKDIPTIPADISAFNNDSGYLVSNDIAGKADKSDTYTKSEVDLKIDEAISGGGDLQNYYTKSEVDTALGNKANSADLANVATSGDYNDLSNKPTIPNAQIQSDWNQDDSTQLDFIKNKPTIPVIPTNVSEFTNDAGYLTQHQDISGKQDVLIFATVAEAEAVAYEMN